MNPMFNAPVVCNAGPLIGLARVNLAWLPFSLFSEVIVPEEVRSELLVKESPDRIQLLEVLNQARIHLIQTVKPYLGGMIRGGYFLGPKLVSSCLDAAGEA
jgi:predicted nucleic acid-binding protein